MTMPAKQGLAIKTRPAIAAASPTTDIIDGLLGEVVQNRLAGKDTPEQAARTSRLHNGQVYPSAMPSFVLKCVLIRIGFPARRTFCTALTLPLESPLRLLELLNRVHSSSEIRVQRAWSCVAGCDGNA